MLSASPAVRGRHSSSGRVCFENIGWQMTCFHCQPLFSLLSAPPPPFTTTCYCTPSILRHYSTLTTVPSAMVHDVHANTFTVPNTPPQRDVTHRLSKLCLFRRSRNRLWKPISFQGRSWDAIGVAEHRCWRSMVKHQPLQVYEKQFFLSFVTGIYGCRWKRYQRSQDDSSRVGQMSEVALCIVVKKKYTQVFALYLSIRWQSQE